MLYLKSCPKCRGDLYLEKDTYGVFRQCLQCGLVQDMGEPARVANPAAEVGAVRSRRGRKRKTLAA